MNKKQFNKKNWKISLKILKKKTTKEFEGEILIQLQQIY